MAKLFVVPKQPVEQPPELEPTETEMFELSGEVKLDLELALRCVGFLLDFVDSVGGADGLRTCADEIHSFRAVQP